VAFSAESLRQLGMAEGFDLANQVPNMNIDAPVADSTYCLRGVGTQDFGRGAIYDGECPVLAESVTR
jgi:hypothetical protein